MKRRDIVLMKKLYQIAIIGLVAFSCVPYANSADAPTSEGAVDVQQVPSEEDEGEEASKAEKVKKTISSFPEKTGNIFLKGFDAVGNQLERLSGNRFETKWNAPPTDADSGARDRSALQRDPAQGT